MPNRPKDQYWKDRTWEFTANSPKPMGPKYIGLLLAAEAKLSGRPAPPAERTVARWQHEFRQLHQGTKDEYRYLFFPESFANTSLPWEASHSLLELLAYFSSRGYDRPLVSVARAYWRVTLACPDLPIMERYNAAKRLAAWEVTSSTDDARNIERFLSGQSTELDGGVHITAGTPEAEMFAALEAAQGSVIPPDSRKIMHDYLLENGLIYSDDKVKGGEGE
jgi:hypothetical protein